MTESEEQERARAAREGLLGRTVAGRYVLRSLLGHGGMGAVYEAEHVGLGKRVAIKFVDPEFATDEQVVSRFAREARAMSAIESAHIVTIFDAGTEDGRPYLVMELLRGEDLGQRLRRMTRIPLAEAMHVTAQVLKGLARAHAAGIVHRDLKPDNIFLARHDTDPLFAKIVDFGVSKIDRPRAGTTPLALTGRGTVLGTPFYMSPEQAQAAPDVDARADLYSVGAILFECLSGRPPHTGESYEQVILSICMRDAPNLQAIEPKVPAEVAAFVARALARPREQRFTSAERMLAALHEIAPAERTRVPLDPPAAKTMVSAGAPVAEAPPAPEGWGGALPSAETRVGVASLEPPLAVGAARAPIAAADARAVAAPAVAGPAPGSPAAAAPVKDHAAGARAERGSHATPEPSARRSALGPRRSAGAVIATAAVATLTGVAATFGLISVFTKRAPDPLPSPSSTTSVSSSTPLPSSTASSSSSSLPASSSAEPAPGPPDAAVASVSAASTPSRKLPSLPSTRPLGSAGAKPMGTRPLDIQRDLP